jgi:hypothetical protein
MRNVHVFSLPKFPVRFNGALVFAVSLILNTGKCIKLFTETVLAFSAYMTQLREKPIAPFESA